MSHWISLILNGEIVTVPCFTEGGTFAVGGSSEADLNVTYNYAPLIYKYFPGGLSSFNGKKAKDTIATLETAVKELGIQQDQDYWQCTAGNVGHTLNILLNWAKVCPDGEWHVN
jgi:hypothetical protein